MGPNPSSVKARIVARIRCQSTKQSNILDDSSILKHPWICVTKPDEKSNPNSSSRVKISFRSDLITSGKQCYEVDECYEHNVGNEEIFSREIKPLIPGLFRGQNGTVFAYGPPSSGKTHTIQGSEEEHGLIMRTIDSILPQAEEEGKIITASVFEVYQDRVIDLLNSKKQEVSVFEDGQGKIRLKGLSKVKVNSTSEFQNVYFHAANVHKPPHRSHIGCIVHVVSPQTENSNAQLVGKINFIDLASYEDSRRKSSDGSNLAETTRINKSLYAVHNVLYALNANEVRVPYRESKLTRMLQDSLGGMNKVLMVSCMNPYFCQDTVQTISLASRSCQAGFLACLDPGKSKSATKISRISPQVLKSTSKISPQVLKSTSKCSPQVLKSTSKLFVRTNMSSPRVMKPMSASASGKKQAGSLLRTSMKKPSGMQTEVKGRKLFDGTNSLKNSEKGNVCLASASANESSAQTKIKLPLKSEAELESSALEEDKFALNASVDSSQLPFEEDKFSMNVASVDSSQLPTEEDKFALNVASVDSSQLPTEEEKSGSIAASDMGSSSQLPSQEEDDVEVQSIITATPTYKTPTTRCFLLVDKENKSLLLNNGASPPLSARIRELSNNLKSLCVSTESSLKKAQDSSFLYNQINESLEPKTPTPQPSLRVDDKHEIANITSPWTNFHTRGSGMKDSLVQEYLKFLNSASKEELKGLKGIGDKRATYILEMREESPEPFKKLDDLKDIGLSEKQIKGMLKNVAGDLFV